MLIGCEYVAQTVGIVLQKMEATLQLMNMHIVLTFLDKVVSGLRLTASAMVAVLLLALAIVGASDVFFDAVLGSGVPVAGEVSAVMLAMITILALPTAQFGNQHINVDILIAMTPDRIQRINKIFALVCTLIFYGFLTWGAYELATVSISMREKAMALYAFPIYPAKICFFVGLLLAVVVCLRQVLGVLFESSSPLPKKPEDFSGAPT